MGNKIFEQDYKEFCELFNGLTVEQAKSKADEMKLCYCYDIDIIDINYKSICATVYDENGVGYISNCVECYNEKGELVKIIE